MCFQSLCFSCSSQLHFISECFDKSHSLPCCVSRAHFAKDRHLRQDLGSYNHCLAVFSFCSDKDLLQLWDRNVTAACTITTIPIREKREAKKTGSQISKKNETTRSEELTVLYLKLTKKIGVGIRKACRFCASSENKSKTYSTKDSIFSIKFSHHWNYVPLWHIIASNNE